MKRIAGWFGIVLAAGLAWAGEGDSGAQPRVAPGPSEPDWVAILDAFYGLRMIDDLENPVRTTAEAAPGRFRKAGPGPVRYRPVLALGMEATTRGGWYVAGEGGQPERRPLWSYTFRSTGNDLEAKGEIRPPLADGSGVEFDPGDREFGLYAANDGLEDGGVFTEPAVVKAVNARLAAQPYKAMIYRVRERKSGQVVPHSYLIGWEYSTNDDFQDVVCLVENVELVTGR